MHWLTLALALQTQFTDVTREAGIDWVHRNGATPEKHLIETMGGGGAFLDFDGDGLLDIFLADSGGHQRSQGAPPGKNALYRNRGDGTFRDVAAKAGVTGGFYANGAAVGDYDNDGDPDLYVTAWGRNRLYRNNGDGTFSEVAAQAGVAGRGWSTSAAFFDMENDGDLDLFVCQYLVWDYELNLYCGERREGYRSYCHPDKFKPLPSLLYRNNGDGTFSEVAGQAGVAAPGKALGVVSGDVDSDGDQDLYVANDAVANFLFRNRGDGTFSEEALLAEVAYGMSVKPESGMGTDLGDFDGDGTLDLIVTNIDYEMNNLYANRDGDFFTDVTIAQGHGQGDLLYSGFGVRFFDMENDGDLDLAVLNGHPLDNIHLYRDRVTAAEEPFLLENRGGEFVNISGRAGPAWGRKMNGRALASGDYDNDGDIDLLFVNLASPPVLLRNDLRAPGPWLGLRLIGTKSNRDAVGARAVLKTDRRTLMRERTGGGSYQAAHDPRLHFGLLEGERIKEITIRWPSGKAQSLESLPLGRYSIIREK